MSPQVRALLERAQEAAFEKGDTRLWSDIDTALAEAAKPVTWRGQEALVNGFHIHVRPFGYEFTYSISRFDRAETEDAAKIAALKMVGWGNMEKETQ